MAKREFGPSPWAVDLERKLHERPPSGLEPTDQERYYDSGSPYGRDDPDPPWTDTSTKREREL